MPDMYRVRALALSKCNLLRSARNMLVFPLSLKRVRFKQPQHPCAGYLADPFEIRALVLALLVLFCCHQSLK
jgi:hypothetical protein